MLVGADLDQGSTDRHSLTCIDENLLNDATIGGREFYERLLGLDLDNDIIDLDCVTDGNNPVHDLGFNEAFTDIGKVKSVCTWHDIGAF
ncbi:hypothetical protein Pd630_LPD16180 (plasmid) [Rhodococcus opacus PD630]|nr:hypothetical protein Pd630_LPD16180 [Rhodococcus opacus PD630]